MHVEDITKVKAGRGTILITPIKENDHVQLGDQKVYVDTSFSKEKHSVSYGRVISVCDTIDESLRTTIEVLPGDIVFFHYLCVMNAIRDQKLFQCDGRKYYSIPYESLYVAKRTIMDPDRYTPKEMLNIYDTTGMLPFQRKSGIEYIICLNGFILVTPKMEHSQDKIGQIFLPDSMISQEQVSRGTVAYSGSLLNGEPEVIKPGDEIIFRKSSSVPLEYELHQAMKKKFYRMKRESVLATSRTDSSLGKVVLSPLVEGN